MTQEIIKVPIQPHFAGDYRIEYDGKYITIYGKDNRYDMVGLFGAPKGTYEEMVLIPVVIEVRNAVPSIVKVSEKEIIINLKNIKP